MLMKPDSKKKILSVIMAGKGPGPEKEMAPKMEDGVEQDDSIAKESAAQDLLTAIEQKDAKGIVMAFTNLMEMCDYEEPSEEEAE